MKMTEIEVWGFLDEKQYRCIMEKLESSNNTDSFTCEIPKPPDAKFQKLLVNISIPLHHAWQLRNKMYMLSWSRYDLVISIPKM